MLADHVAEHAEMPFADYVREAVCAPLEIELDPSGDPGSGMHASLADVLAIGRELLSPRLVADETRDEMVARSVPGARRACSPTTAASTRSTGDSASSSTRGRRSWMGARTSPRTYGHFGGTGTFLWVDPDARVVCAALTTREFDEWAKEAWPRFADAVLAELRG